MIKIYLIYIQYIAYTGLDQGGTMDTESKTYDEAEFQRLYDQLLGYLGKDQELAEQIKKLRMPVG